MKIGSTTIHHFLFKPFWPFNKKPVVFQEMSSLSRSSPHTPRLGNLIKNHQQMLQQQQMQETSFSNPTPLETEATISKINTM
jgi:hypothetical protein